MDQAGMQMAGVQDDVQRTLCETGTPGAFVGAVMGEREWLWPLGWRDVRRGLPVTGATLFGLGSLTKSVTALTALRLARHRDGAQWSRFWEAGRVARFPAMTLHRLLSHTAGLPPLQLFYRCFGQTLQVDRRWLPPEWLKGRCLADLTDLEEALNDWAGVEFPEGARPFSYSNVGYALVAARLAAATGRPLAQLAQELVLAPTGVDHALTFQPLSPDAEATALYTRYGGMTRETPGWWHGPLADGVIGLLGTGPGLLAYLKELLSSSDPDVRRLTGWYTDAAPGTGYGYGFLVHRHPVVGRWAEHGGRLKGAAAWVVLVPAKRLAVAVLTNLTDGPARHVAYRTVRGLLGCSLPIGRAAIQPDGASLADWSSRLGRYGHEEGIQIEVQPGPAIVVNGEPCPLGWDRWGWWAQVGDEREPLTWLTGPSGDAWGLTFHLRVLGRVPEPGSRRGDPTR